MRLKPFILPLPDELPSPLPFILIIFENSGFYGREKTGKFKHDRYQNIEFFKRNQFSILLMTFVFLMTLLHSPNSFSQEPPIQKTEKLKDENKNQNPLQLLPKDVFYQPGGGFRLRYDYLDNFDNAFPKNRKASEISHRIQMDLKLHKGEFFETFFRLIHYSDPEMDLSQKPKSLGFPNTGLILNQAWGFWKIDDSFGLRFGRLPIHIGLGYTYGANDWFNVPYSFDLVDLIWDFKTVHLSLILAKAIGFGGRSPHFQRFLGDERHIIASLDVQDLFNVLNKLNLSFVQVNRDPSQNSEEENTPIFNGLNAQRFGLETEFEGKFFFGSVFISYGIGEENITKILQTNNNEEKNKISQSAFDVKFGYQLTNFKNLKIWSGYHMDTGDGSPADNNSQSYDSFYYEVYGQSGLMDFIRWGNLSFFKAGLEMNLKDNWIIGTEWLNFSRTEEADRIQFGRAGQILNAGLDSGNITLGTGSQIGSEFDLFTNLKFEKGISLRTTLSVFVPGSSLKNTKSDIETLPTTPIYQCLTQIQYFF